MYVIMNIHNSLVCIYYNLLSNFYICLNMIFPYYNNEILHLQYKTIEQINDTIIFEDNYRKRKRFNNFIENLIQKNNDLLEKLRKQEEEDNNISNYEKISAIDGDDTQMNTDEQDDDIESEISNDVVDNSSEDIADTIYEDKKTQ